MPSFGSASVTPPMSFSIPSALMLRGRHLIFSRYRPDRRSAAQFEGPEQVSDRPDRWDGSSVFLAIATRPTGRVGSASWKLADELCVRSRWPASQARDESEELAIVVKSSTARFLAIRTRAYSQKEAGGGLPPAEGPTPSARPREGCGLTTTGPGEGQGLGEAGVGGFQRRCYDLKLLENCFTNGGICSSSDTRRSH
jgi:hypothetical protein